MLKAAIFDMDGLLVESESRWRQAEEEVCADLGLSLTTADFDKTMGVRMREVADLWFQWDPWVGPTPAEVATRVTDRVIELNGDAVPLPGVLQALDRFEEAGLRLAVCSSSDLRMIEPVLEVLCIRDRFEVVHSAENDVFGKPHPMPYLETATLLGVNSAQCIALEDSVAGTVSAKAAGMQVISVPDSGSWGSAQFGIADVVLHSLEQLDAGVLTALADGVPIPTLSRPRFHLAFGVDDLAQARWFYGEVLGCREGRSDTRWVDFDFWGHQIVAHLTEPRTDAVATSDVDGHQVPGQHFGLILPAHAWIDLVTQLKAADIPFVMEPTVRFEGQPGEQRTCFVLDPAGNALELKSVLDDRLVFSANQTTT